MSSLVTPTTCNWIIDAGENLLEKNEDNERMEEKIDMLNNVDEVIADKISKYDDDATDAAYGGYERENNAFYAG